jgi:hypothetical protein
MDYSVKLWWEGVDLVGDAIRRGDPRPIEAALRRYRDRVVAAGGVCSIDTATLDGAPLAQRLLAAATVATIGELFLEIGDGATRDDGYRQGVRAVLQAQRDFPALCAGGTRTVLSTSGGDGVYAFLRQGSAEDVPVLVARNFANEHMTTTIDLEGRELRLRDLRTGVQAVANGRLTLALPAYGYALYAVDLDR